MCSFSVPFLSFEQCTFFESNMNPMRQLMLNAKSPADVFGCFVRAEVFIQNKYEFEPTFVKKKKNELLSTNLLKFLPKFVD